MFRSVLSAALCALLLPGIAAARSYEAQPAPSKGRVEVVVNRNVVQLNYLLVLNRDQPVGLDLRKAVRQIDDREAGVRTLIRDLSQRPLDSQLAHARKVGTIYYAMRTLFVLPDDADIDRTHALIRTGDLSYMPTPLMNNFKLEERPSESLLKERGIVGEAWHTGDRLILLVEPVLGSPMF